MTNPRLYIRAARAADRDIVVGFSLHSFYWGDYLPNVWDRWLQDPKGKLIVATHNRKPVAVAHLTMIAPGEGWCEGLRVDPAYRKQRVATMIAGRTLEELKKQGAKVARFATASTNEPVHRMAPVLGFEKVMALRAYRAGAVGSGPALVHPRVEDCERLFSFLQGSTMLKAMGGLCNSGWRFQALTIEVLKKRLEKEMLRVLEHESRLEAVAITGPGYGNIRGLAVGYVDGSPEALTCLLSGLRAEAAVYDPPEVTVWVPELPFYEKIFSRAGFTRPSEGVFVYQRNL